MLLRNLLSVEDNQLIDIGIENEYITAISNASDIQYSSNFPVEIVFENAIVFPGLINSHDHLDFNSFPQLGNKIYNNYVDWGKDIHENNKSQINKVLQIPPYLRVQWGIYKNLLNGVTTVVNHGPKLSIENAPVSIFQQCNILHSVQLEKNWKYKLNNPFAKPNLPVVVHIGEGTDLSAQREIDKLLKWNLMQRNLIGVHAIAMNERQAKGFRAIVWCPHSNQFLIGKTADIAQLKNHTKILFGTDSTVSSDWNLWKHLELARSSNMVTDKDLYYMLTKNAASIWNFQDLGELKKNYRADLVIAKRKKDNALNSFFSVQPEDILLLMHQGKMRLFDESLYQILHDQKINLDEFHAINLNKSWKFVWGNLPSLMAEIKSYYPEAEFPIN